MNFSVQEHDDRLQKTNALYQIPEVLTRGFVEPPDSQITN